MVSGAIAIKYGLIAQLIPVVTIRVVTATGIKPATVFVHTGNSPKAPNLAPRGWLSAEVPPRHPFTGGRCQVSPWCVMWWCLVSR